MIQMFIHVSKSNAVGLEKIKDLIDNINEKSKAYFYPGNNYDDNKAFNVTIDERMISWQGRSTLVKYEPMKPTKWGFRPYVLADTSTGYTYHMTLSESLEEDDTHSKTEKLVMDLMSTLSGYHLLATDSFYTSEKLLNCKWAFVGSIKKSRCTIPKEENEEKLSMNSCVFYKKGNMLLTKFRDKKVVYVISNCQTNVIEEKVRWQKEKDGKRK